MIAMNVYNRAMDLLITITQKELLSLSPEVRSQVREATTTCRQPTIPVVQGMVEEAEDSPYELYNDGPLTPTFTVTSPCH